MTEEASREDVRANTNVHAFGKLERKFPYLIRSGATRSAPGGGSTGSGASGPGTSGKRYLVARPAGGSSGRAGQQDAAKWRAAMIEWRRMDTRILFGQPASQPNQK